MHLPHSTVTDPLQNVHSACTLLCCDILRQQDRLNIFDAHSTTLKATGQAFYRLMYLVQIHSHHAHVIPTDHSILVCVQGLEGLPHPVTPLLILLHLHHITSWHSCHMCLLGHMCCPCRHVPCKLLYNMAALQLRCVVDLWSKFHKSRSAHSATLWRLQHYQNTRAPVYFTHNRSLIQPALAAVRCHVRHENCFALGRALMPHAAPSGSSACDLFPACWKRSQHCSCCS